MIVLDDRQSSPRRPVKSRAVLLCAGWLWLAAAVAQSGIPSFEATSLTGEKVSSDVLIGQWTLLIVTPSRDAAESTRRWAEALRGAEDMEHYLVRDVLAIDLPFFMSEADAIEKAREAVPERFHEQTWLLNAPVLEKALGIPRDSDHASVFVLNETGEIVSRVDGEFNDERLGVITDTLSRKQ